MLKKFVAAAVVVACTMSVAYARSTEMYEPERATLVAADGKQTKEKMRSAVIAGSKTKGWVLTAEKPGTLTLRNHNGKYGAVIDVDFDEKGYQIKYVSSDNLNFNVKDGGKPNIHPTYNTWVKELGYAIDHAY